MTKISDAPKKDLLKIPQHIIDDIVDQNDLTELVGHHLKLKKQGKDYIALCPFHRETTPSFTLSPVRQFYYCFGCGASGNALNFMMNYLGKSFISVVQDLAEEVGIDLTPYLKMAQNQQLEFQMHPAMASANAFFSHELRRPGEHARRALDYLVSRQIPQDIIDRFSLGFAGYSQHIVDNLMEYQDVLIEGGVLEQGKEGRGVFSLFRDRLMMPIRDMKGKTIGLSGRTLKDELPKYRNSKESTLFSRNSVLYGLHESVTAFGKGSRLERIFVVEGQFDVLAKHMINLAAGAAMGSSLSIQQLRLLLRYTKHVTFIFDGDKAGLKALVQVGALLLENITDHEVVFDVVLLPEGKDPHTMITEDLDTYRALIAEPHEWLDTVLRHLPEAVDLESDRGRAEFASRAVELVHDTRDPLLRHQALEKAARLCKMPVEALSERLLSMPASRSGHAKPPQAVLNDSAVRLTRMLWDEPLWAQAMDQEQLWLEEGDELIQTLVNWKIELLKGTFDQALSPEDNLKLEENPYLSKELEAQCRKRGGAAALGRRLAGLQEGRLMESLMREEPETARDTAYALAQHITGMFAGQAMQKLSSKAAMGLMTENDQAVFANLLKIRRESVIKTKNL